ncbi:MAG TPA: hypothetical protein VEC76_19715 [Streptosporangiaceae bacterium]|nr:hypothetical protein [Streptosporangiaceae bacterium]
MRMTARARRLRAKGGQVRWLDADGGWVRWLEADGGVGRIGGLAAPDGRQLSPAKWQNP